MKLNPTKSFKEVLKMAKKTYKKGASTVKYAITGKKTKKVKKGKKKSAKKNSINRKKRKSKTLKAGKRVHF